MRHPFKVGEKVVFLGEQDHPRTSRSVGQPEPQPGKVYTVSETSFAGELNHLGYPIIRVAELPPHKYWYAYRYFDRLEDHPDLVRKVEYAT